MGEVSTLTLGLMIRSQRPGRGPALEINSPLGKESGLKTGPQNFRPSILPFNHSRNVRSSPLRVRAESFFDPC